MSALIDTTAMAERMRERIIRPARREILITRVAGSAQEPDFSVPPNAGGLGRIRHFRRETPDCWPDNPLPIDPAAKALGIEAEAVMRAQVFQNAACAWRCWYCYVPFNLLGGDERRGEWMSAEALVDAFAAEPDRASVLDLSGGSPDLTPEWVVWTMDALERRGLADQVYLWSDDNLSTDYVFTRLDAVQRARLAEYRNYGRVCCFKGFDEESFRFNTGAAEGFDRQFELFKRYLELGMDVYGYVTLTGPSTDSVETGIPALMDRLQSISANLPLRVVPLAIAPFGPMLARPEGGKRAAGLDVQEAAIKLWEKEIARRFDVSTRARSIAEVAL
jgi:uncharacterized Fe-S cluster-containing radical SAM superfamily protein